MPSKKQERLEKAKKTARNQQILGSLRAEWSAKKVEDEYELSYSWAKKLCNRLLGENGERKPGSGRFLKRAHWYPRITSDSTAPPPRKEFQEVLQNQQVICEPSKSP